MKLSYNLSSNGRDRARPEPFAAGIYDFWIVDVEQKKPKAGGPDYLLATLEIVGGEHGGRRVWEVFAIDHPTAGRYARHRLDDLGLSSGIRLLTDSDQLIGQRCRAEAGIEPASDEYPAKNKIVRYLRDDHAADGGAGDPEKPASSAGVSTNTKAELPDDDVGF